MLTLTKSIPADVMAKKELSRWVTWIAELLLWFGHTEEINEELLA